MLKLEPVQLCVKFVDSPMPPGEVIESSDVAMSDGVMTCFLCSGRFRPSFRFLPRTPARGAIVFRTRSQSGGNPSLVQRGKHLSDLFADVATFDRYFAGEQQPSVGRCESLDVFDLVVVPAELGI